MFLTFRFCRLAPNDFPTDASFLTTLKSIRDQSPLQTATLDRNPIHAHVVTSRQADVVLIENSCGPTNVAIGRRVAIEAGRGRTRTIAAAMIAAAMTAAAMTAAAMTAAAMIAAAMIAAAMNAAATTAMIGAGRRDLITHGEIDQMIDRRNATNRISEAALLGDAGVVVQRPSVLRVKETPAANQLQTQRSQTEHSWIIPRRRHRLVLADHEVLDREAERHQGPRSPSHRTSLGVDWNPSAQPWGIRDVQNLRLTKRMIQTLIRIPTKSMVNWKRVRLYQPTDVLRADAIGDVAGAAVEARGLEATVRQRNPRFHRTTHLQVRPAMVERPR
jgi:hypothetical protein